MAKRAINLARVSTPQQAKLYSLDYQIQQMQEYDVQVGLVVVAEFKDDMSGRKLDRDGLEEACQMLENDQADVLVTWKFDRLHRNYVNAVVLRDRIRRAGKEIHYAQTRQISGKTARERLPEDIQYIMAEIDADTIAENTQGGKLRKAQAGKWIGLNRPPYGYTKVGQGKSALLVLDEEAAKIVVLIFTWYVLGEDEAGPLSTQEIADKLIAMGVPRPADRVSYYSKMLNKNPGHWSRDTVNYILRTEAYSGVYYQKFRQNTERVGIPVPAIVDADIFRAAQHKLDTGRQLAKRGLRFEYLIGRRIRCACKYAMRSMTSCMDRVGKDGEIKSYRYPKYRCPARWKSRAHTAECTIQPLDANLVDARVWQWVKEEIANPVILERKLREIQAQEEEKNTPKHDRLRVLQKHKEEIESELKRIGMLYGKLGMPNRIVDDMIAQEGHKLALTEADIAKLQTELATPLTDATIENVLALSFALQERLEEIEKSFAKKRRVIDGLDVRVEIVRKSVDGREDPDGDIWLNLTSILRSEVMSLPLLFSSSTYSITTTRWSPRST